MTPETLNVSWADYIVLLESQRRRHPNLRLSAPARDADQHTYLGQARAARAAFERHEKFGRMRYEDARLVAGFGPHAAWFGSMGGNGVWMNLVRTRPAEVARIIDPIPMYSDDRDNAVSNDLVIRAFKAAEDLPQVGIGCITRLLCMKRPDRFFTVNAGNRRRMRELLGAVPRDATEYIDAVELLRTYPWYDAPKPERTGDDEYELWRSRVSLLDAILYEPA